MRVEWDVVRKASGLMFSSPAEARAAQAMLESVPDAPAPVAEAPAISPSAITLDQMPYARHRWNTGDTFPGGYGATEIVTPDYWTLRARSVELFETNLFARGIIRRLVTQVIAAGLYLEATPNESLLGLERESLSEWSDLIEGRFALWSNDRRICDHQGLAEFGALQAEAWREALISGDVLVTLRQSRSGVTQVRLHRGDAVQTPLLKTIRESGRRIEHGVELDDDDRHVAYWVRQRNGTFQRLPAVGASGRRLAWLCYATDKRFGDVRGQPILSLILERLKELLRYQSATVRKAVLNSFLTMSVEKQNELPGSRPLAAGAALASTESATGADGAERAWRTHEFVPGLILHELQAGETVKQHGGQGTDEKYGDFEAAITQGLAWALEIPPEVLRLSFSSNYSASKAAENNLDVYLFTVRSGWSRQMCHPVYEDWLIGETLRGQVSAPGLLDAWRDVDDYVRFAAWVSSEWSGNIKPSVDPVKQVEGYKRAIAEGLTTRARACREFSGMKFAKVAEQLKRENELLAEANKSLAPPAPAPTSEQMPEDDAEDQDDEQDRRDREDAA